MLTQELVLNMNFQCYGRMVKSIKIKCWILKGMLSVFYQRYAPIQKSHQSSSVFPEIIDASSPVCWLKILNLVKQDFSMCWKTLLLLNKSQIDLLSNSIQSFWKLQENKNSFAEYNSSKGHRLDTFSAQLKKCRGFENYFNPLSWTSISRTRFFH